MIVDYKSESFPIYIFGWIDIIYTSHHSSDPLRSHVRNVDEYGIVVVHLITIVYIKFVKIIVATFVLKWRVGYKYEETVRLT